MIREDILLGVTAAYRESFHVFTFRICFMTQPASRYTYCQSKARYSWSIFQKKNLILQAAETPSTYYEQLLFLWYAAYLISPILRLLCTIGPEPDYLTIGHA